MRKHSHGLFAQLKSSGAASLTCQKALQQAQKSQSAYFDACAALTGREVIPVCVDKDEHAVIQLQVDVLHRFKQFETDLNLAVRSAQVYVEEYYCLKEASASSMAVVVSSHRKSRIKADIEHLRKLRDKSKRFSSDSWTCVLLNQL